MRKASWHFERFWSCVTAIVRPSSLSLSRCGTQGCDKPAKRFNSDDAEHDGGKRRQPSAPNTMETTMIKDAQGQTVSGATAASVALYDQAVRAFNLGYGDSPRWRIRP
jgi:hypothetical protein